MKKLLPVVFLSFCIYGQAQTVLENNPPSLKWYQVNTPHFRVLFPKGFEEQGTRVANTLESLRDAEAKSMGSPPRKISVILQNQSSVSNGFVTLLPRRSEFYAMPSQDYNFIATNDWLDMLSSHEYRHIVQYQHATRGFNRLFYYLFGATTLVGMSQAAAPEWFWEGDAVATETAFLPNGRGKTPNFGLLFKTNLLEGREFNYHKQYLRSYKHNIPNEYVLGFYMISYLRKRTNDPDIWEKITARSWNVPFIPFAFSNAIKKESGLYVTRLYREMAKDFRKQWSDEMRKMTFTDAEPINGRKNKAYTDYLYPQQLSDGTVLAMKRGIGDIEKFVTLNEGKEKRVFIPGYMNHAGMLSVTDSKVVWNEYGYSPRWGVKNYSLVKVFDRYTRRLKVLGTRKDRFGSAALSPDESKVVTVRTSTEYKTQLVVLDVASGRVLKEFENPENYFCSMPRWFADSPDGNRDRIAFLKTTKQGKALSVLEYATGNITDILPPSQENIGHPVPYGDYILYNSPVSGIDNIYAVKVSTGERYQITSSRYGAYNPSVSKDGSTLFYNDQQRDGQDVVKIPFAPDTWQPMTPVEQPVEFYSHLVEQEGRPTILSNVPQQSLPTKKYSKLKGLINPYTWGLNVNSDLTTATVGLSSRDILSTTSIDLGYIYDVNERTGSYQAGISYQGWYPIIDFSVAYADRSVNEGDFTYFKTINGTPTRVVENLTFDWQEFTVEGGLRVPLNLTRSRYSTNVTIANNVGYKASYNFTNSIDGGGRVVPTPPPHIVFRDYVDYGGLVYNNFSLSAYRLMKQSRRDINSKWGQRIFLDTYNTPFGGDYTATQLSVYGIGYFPGLFKHHSFWGYGAYQYTEMEALTPSSQSNNYIFRSGIPLPRGHSVVRLQDMYTASANYTFPVWYPDIAIGPLLNIQRLRTNLFFDYGMGEGETYSPSANAIVPVTRYYSSVGVEAKVDINILRFLPQLDVGIRYSKGLNPATSLVEVLIGTFRF
jgi:hypothetical protein